MAQVLGLVDDDDDVPSRQVLVEKEHAQLVEQLDPLGAVIRDAELRQQRLQQLDVTQRRVYEPRRDVLAVRVPAAPC